MHKNGAGNFAPQKGRKREKRTWKCPKRAKPGAFWVLEGVAAAGDGCGRVRKPGKSREGEAVSTMAWRKWKDGLELASQALLRCPALSAAAGRLANRRPLRHPRLAASATGGASAAMPDTLRAPRLHPQSLRKKRDKQTLVSLFWQGQKDLVSAAASVGS